MRRFKIIICVMAILLATSITAAKYRDILYMNDGSEHVGELVRITESEIVFSTSDGDQETIDPDSVRSIDLGTWRPGDDWKNRIDIDDPILSTALENADEASRKYTSANYITLYEKGELTVDSDGSATLTERYIYYIANESGKNKANWSTRYFSDVQDVTVDYARAVGLSKVSTVADNAIEDASTNPILSEYQRQRSKKFALTGASLGSVVDYHVTTRFKKLDMFNGLSLNWRFYDTEPKLVSIFEVFQKGDVDLAFKETDVPKPKKVKRDGYSGRAYRMENIEPYVEENMLPNLDLILPNVVVTLPADLEKLSASYAAKIDEAMDAVGTVESRLTAEFPGGKPTIEQVYNYVSENYTTNGIGMTNYYPYPKPLSKLLEASRIAQHELVFLLYAFLEAAGGDPELVMVGPSLDSPLSPDMFNIQHFHSLRVKVKDGSELRYLAPNEFLRYDHQYLSGVWVLPVKKSGAKIERIPRVAGDFAYSIPRYDCVLGSDGVLDVTWTVSYHGPTGGDRYRYHKNDKPRELDNYFDGVAKSIDEMADMVDYKLTGYKSLAERVELTYSVRIPGFAVRAGEEILAFKLPTVKFGASQVGAAERTLPFSLPGNFYGEKIIDISLPKGYEIEHLPESVELSCGYRDFEGDVSVSDGVLKYRQISKGKHSPVVQAKDYPKYKNFVERRSKFADNWILIKKSS
ncbi:DUF3857 domain-containing protein [bacterium]|nr:DUF3857 domain-containing protein [bacterium]